MTYHSDCHECHEAQRRSRAVKIQLTSKRVGISAEFSGPASSIPELEAAAIQVAQWFGELAADPNLAHRDAATVSGP